MSPEALASLGGGFSNEAFGSQSVFRAALTALSRPGSWVDVHHDARTPEQGNSAAAAALLALLDPDCVLWVSPQLSQGVALAWLRFHTGCQVTNEPGDANFLWFHRNDDLVAFSGLLQGSDNYPDQSATVVIDLEHTDAYAHDLPIVVLTGPGIETQCVFGLPAGSGMSQAKFKQLIRDLQNNEASFPQGVDVLLSTTSQLMGLPRSTRVSKGKGT